MLNMQFILWIISINDNIIFISFLVVDIYFHRPSGSERCVMGSNNAICAILQYDKFHWILKRREIHKYSVLQELYEASEVNGGYWNY